MQAWLREGNIGASHVAIPECSLRAKHTRGLESKLESLAGFELQIRSPRVHVPSAGDVPTSETVGLYTSCSCQGRAGIALMLDKLGATIRARRLRAPGPAG
jgi:hypothetical protein